MTTVVYQNSGGGGFVSDHPLLATAVIGGAGAGAGAITGHYLTPTLDSLEKDTFVTKSMDFQGKKVASEIQKLENYKNNLDNLNDAQKADLRKILNLKEDVNLPDKRKLQTIIMNKTKELGKLEGGKKSKL